MKRFSVAVLLTLLGSTAHASGYSFSIGGHHITIDAGRHCRSLSCVSWSDSRPRRSRRDDDDAAAPAAVTPAPARPVASAPACSPVAAPAAPAAPETATPQSAPVQVPVKSVPVVQAQAPPAFEPAAANVQAGPKEVAIGKPKEKATVEATVIDKPVDLSDWAEDWSPKDAAAPKTSEKSTKVVAHEDDSPVGDWQTEGKKGQVRIERCGAALCGYLLNETTNTTAETVLSNMKLKTGTQWAGDIYSRASGNTYYARMTFKRPDTLRVEACAIGRFFCSGNDWTRVPGSDEVLTSRKLPAAPKS